MEVQKQHNRQLSASFQMQLAEYMEVAKTSYNTPAKIIQEDKSAQLYKMHQHYPMDLYVLLSRELDRVFKFFSVKTNITADAAGMENAKELLELIIETYPRLRISDVILIFKRAKIGHYGELYNRLDGPVVLSWFRKYEEERLEALHTVRQREKESHYKAPVSSEIDKEGLSKIAQLMGKIGAVQRDKGKQIKKSYDSLESYAKDQGLDPDQYMRDFKAEFKQWWEDQSDIETRYQENLYRWKYNQKLHEINQQIKVNEQV